MLKISLQRIFLYHVSLQDADLCPCLFHVTWRFLPSPFHNFRRERLLTCAFGAPFYLLNLLLHFSLLTNLFVTLSNVFVHLPLSSSFLLKQYFHYDDTETLRFPVCLYGIVWQPIAQYTACYLNTLRNHRYKQFVKWLMFTVPPIFPCRMFT